MPAPTTSIQHCIGSPSQWNKARKMKEPEIWKGRVNAFLVTDNMIGYVGNTKESTNNY